MYNRTEPALLLVDRIAGSGYFIGLVLNISGLNPCVLLGFELAYDPYRLVQARPLKSQCGPLWTSHPST